MNRLRRWWRRRRARALYHRHLHWTTNALVVIAARDPALARTLWGRVNGIVNDAVRTARPMPDALGEVSDLLLGHLQEIEDAMEAAEEIAHA